MITKNWLSFSEKLLEAASVGTARLDALVLLEDVTGKDRSWLLANPEFEIMPKQQAILKNVLNRRAEHYPLAYIRGKIEFYGRDFVLTPAVLQPRPESETMIDLLVGLSLFHPPIAKRNNSLEAYHSAPSTSHSGQHTVRISDVGTGSGALGITAKLELPDTQVELLEIDPKAIEIAKINVDKFTLNITITKSDLLTATGREYDVLLCNLPYVPDSHTINHAASREPKIAIFGGPDGLDIYRRLFRQVSKRLSKPLYILTESLPPQHPILLEIAGQYGYQLHQTDDFIQVFQSLKIRA